MRRPLRLSALLAGSASLVGVLAACGNGDGGSSLQSRSVAYTGFCPDIVLCIAGDHWDTHECKCVPDGDAGTVADAATEAATDASPDAGACVDTMLCIAGDHWDPGECRCVPNADAGNVQDAGGGSSVDAGDDGDDATPCDTP